MKRLLIIFVLGLLPLFIFAADNDINVPTATLELLTIQSLYTNGDVVELTGSGFASEDQIIAVVLLVNNKDGSYDYKIMENYNLSINSGGQLSGSVILDQIDENDVSLQIVISSLYSSVVPTNHLKVVGDIPHFSTQMNNEAAPFAFTEASGDNIAQLNEQFNITTPNSGWVPSPFSPPDVVLCIRQEYSTSNATGAPIASVSLPTAGFTISGGQLSGNTNNGPQAYNALTLTMRLDVMDGTFSYGTSTSYYATFADVTPPNLVQAFAVSLDTIRLIFDEPVIEVGGLDAFYQFSFEGTASGGISASAVLPVGGDTTDVWDLVISGLTDRGIGNLELLYDSTSSSPSPPDSGVLEDESQNEVKQILTGNGITVEDSIPPNTPIVRDSSNSIALTVSEFLGNTTYRLRARVLNGGDDSSLDGVLFEGSDNGSAWTALGTDASATIVVDSAEFDVVWNIATQGQFKVLRARAFDDAGAGGANGTLDSDDNVAASAVVGSASDGFNNNFEDTYQALISSVTPDPIEASSGSNRAEMVVQLQSNYGSVINTTGSNIIFRFSESSSSSETWWSVSSGGTGVADSIDLTINSSSTSGSVWYSNTLAGGPYTLVLREPAGNFSANGGLVTANNQTISVLTGTPSRIWVQLPGQSFVSGSGVTGTPDDSTTTDTLVVGLFVTDEANNLVNFNETRDLEYETTANDAPDATQPSVNSTAVSSVSATTISTTFIDGTDSVNVHFPAAENGVTLTVSDTTLADTLGGITSSGMNILASALTSFQFVMSSPQRDGEVVTGTNTITALDVYENVITAFDAAVNNVTVTGTGPGTATITGLGSGNNNILNQTSDFSFGVADLTAQAMTIDVSIAGTYTFTATSGSATGQATNIAVSRVVNVSNPNRPANALLDTTITGTDFDLSATLDGSENPLVSDDFRLRWGFNSSGIAGSYGLIRQSPDLTPGGTIQYVVPDEDVKTLGASYDYMFWWVENISVNPNATILEGLPVPSAPRRLILNPNLITLGGINGGDVAQGSFTPGVQNQEIVSILFQSNPSAANIQITNLTFDKSGTAVAADLDIFRLFLDGGTLGQYDAGVDVLLKSFTFVGGTSVNFSTIPNLNVTGTANYILVTVDVASGADPLNTLGLRLPDEQAVTVNGNNVINGPATAITVDPFTNLGTSTDYSLPVTLVNFSAKPGFGEIVLEWSTGSEQDNSGFYLMRSPEEKGEYTRVNTELIQGNGNSNTLNLYTYKDSEVEPETDYFYKLYSVDFDGEVHVYGTIASGSAKVLPKEFSLAQNYPNPFNPTTRISFDVAQESSISLVVYNMLGQKVRTLIDNQRYQPGVYSEINWDAKDDSGNSIANGIYYLVFSANDYGYRQVRKMVFMK